MTTGNTMDDLNTLLEERGASRSGSHSSRPSASRRRRMCTSACAPTTSRDSTPSWASCGATAEGLQRVRVEPRTARFHARHRRTAAPRCARRDRAASHRGRGVQRLERANMELAACDADIARLESERAAATTELGRLQEILALVRQPEARPGRAAAPGPATTAAGATAPRTEADSAADELGVPELGGRSVPRLRPHPARSCSGGPAAAGSGAHSSLAATTGRRRGHSAGDEPADFRQDRSRCGAAHLDLGRDAAFLKGMPTEQVKSLKCQECGTMNHPTELATASGAVANWATM